METKLKPVLELTNLEAEKELTELLGGCWHDFKYIDYPLSYVCTKCNAEFIDKFCEHPSYATSYDAIVPVIKEMDIKQKKKLNELVWIISFTEFCCKVPARGVLNAVIKVLRSK